MKFKVCLQQYVEKITEIEVEAEDPHDAITIAKSKTLFAEWKDGDDAYDVAAYAVKDEHDDLLWER